MCKTRFAALVIMGLLFSSVIAISTATGKDSPNSPLWEQLLRWLPEDTETLIVAQGPYELRSAKPDSKEPPKAKPADQVNWPNKFEEVIQMFVSGSEVDEKKIPYLDLTGVKMKCAIQGSRCFTPPKRFGMTMYQGCQIMKFEDGSEAAVNKAFTNCLAKAENKKELLGHQVAIYTIKSINPNIVQDDWTYYVCQPQPGVLLHATHEGYLEETLKRIKNKPGRRALPATLLQWKHVDTKAPVWAIRQFSEKTAKNDPLSPLNPESAEPDRAAIGCVFWYHPNHGKTAYIRYMTGPETDVQKRMQRMVDSGGALKAKITKIGPGVVEIAGEVSEEESRHMFFFVLFGFLGHAIIL